MQFFEKASKMMALQERFIHNLVKDDVEAVAKMFEVEATPENPEPLIPDVNGEIQDHPVILFAAKRNNWKMVSELFFHGANLDVCDASHGWYFVNEVIIGASDKMFEGLVAECNMDVATRDGDSPLMVALKNDKFERAEYLLRNTGVQYSTINSKKENAGHEAIRKGRYDFFLELVKAGMAYDLKNKEGKTPLDLLDNAMIRNSIEQKIEVFKLEGNVRHAPSGTRVLVATEEEVKPKVVDAEKKKVSGLSSIKRS